REDPRDAFCSRNYSKIEDLPQRARVGTSSLRRQAQLRAIRPDLDIHPLRGNVDTRLRKLEQGEYDAIILAAAGLKRLGKTELVKQIIPAEIMCPAAGQGALAIEIRQGDAAMRQHLEFLNDPAARAATTCERALLNRLGGGCQVPIGAFAEVRSAGRRSPSAPSQRFAQQDGEKDRGQETGKGTTSVVPIRRHGPDRLQPLGFAFISNPSWPIPTAPKSSATPATETIPKSSATMPAPPSSAAVATPSSPPSTAAASPSRPNHDRPIARNVN
ncbi:MAG: hydroxymethylbilane synthase, partial [Candidatus Sulfotelmatobacter sp.]